MGKEGEKQGEGLGPFSFQNTLLDQFKTILPDSSFPAWFPVTFHSPGRLRVALSDPRGWQGMRHSSAVTKELPNLSPSLSLLLSLGWCSGILISAHNLAVAQEGTVSPPILRKGVWVNSLSKVSLCFPKIRHKDSAAGVVI